MSIRSCTSSFQKKGKPKIVSIPGTRPSIHNSQLLSSTGVPSFDFIVGGGLPVGSIVLIEEDTFDVYSKLLLKFYLAEGVLNKHEVFVASLDENPVNILKDLPAPYEETNKNTKSENGKEELKIAWRYQDQKLPNQSSNQFGHNFCLTKSINFTEFENLASTWDGSCVEESPFKFSNPIYWSLLQAINKKIKDHGFFTASNKIKSNLLRIAIHSLVSPLWGSEHGGKCTDKDWTNVTSFLTMLKGLVRSSFSVAMITIPSHLIIDTSLMNRLNCIVDFVIKLESFQGSNKETNPVFKDFHGLFHIKKLASINTIVPPSQVDYLDWAFSLKQKKLSIKRLHLPPELSEHASRSQGGPVTTSSGSCSGNSLPRNLDF